jgi:hypothetical protein
MSGIAHTRTLRSCLLGAAIVLIPAGDVSSAGRPPIPIEWDKSTLTLIQAGAGYGRMIRLDDGRILCAYARHRHVGVRTSRDEGKTWGDEVVAATFDFGSATNPELLLVDDGRVLLSYNERPRDGRHPFAIMIAASSDRGESWTGHRRVYAAGTRPETGCWEPAAIQLPSGEIQLFFANEKPYPKTGEQEITLIRSHDRARSWSEPETASFRPGHRDGMPVPLVLAGGRGIALAIEDNGIAGAMKPAIVHTSLADNWRQPPAGGASPRRWPALEEPLPPDVYAGAPYLCRLPGGETLLSVQSTEGRPGGSGHERSRMVVYVGDEDARHFAGRTVPFDVAPDDSGLWNSLFVKNSATVTAVSGTTIDGVRGLWAVDGRVRREADLHRGRPVGE